jgi:hypothetical protein
MMKEIYSHTPPPTPASGYPAYISVSSDRLGETRIIVRSVNAQTCSEIFLTREQLGDLAYAALKHLDNTYQ